VNKKYKKAPDFPKKHIGDYENYPISNELFNQKIIPSKIIDYDRDRIVNVEDCYPLNKNKQGIISRIVNRIKYGKNNPSYNIDLSGTPADYTKDTSGNLVSTPGTSGTPGINGTYGNTTPTTPSPNNGGGGGGSSYVPTPPPSTTVTATKSGAVRVEETGQTTHTYTGNAYIKNLGMTANQYNQQLRQKLIQEGYNKDQLRRGTYSYKTKTYDVDKTGTTQEDTSKGTTISFGTKPTEQINLLNKKEIYGGTQLSYGNRIEFPQEVYTAGTIYKTQTGETETGIPIFSTFEVQEKGGAKQLSYEESKQYFPSELEVGTGRTTKVGIIYGELLGKAQKLGGEEFYAGTLLENKINIWGSSGGKTKKITSEILTGIIPSTKGELVKSAVLFGAGYGLGVVTQVGGRAVSLIPKVGKYAQSVYKGVTTVGGIYLTGKYATEIAKQVKTTGNYESLGTGIRELSLMGIGFKGGTKFSKSWTEPYTKEIYQSNEAFREGKAYNIKVDNKGTYRQIVERVPRKISITTTKLRETFPRIFKPLKIKSTPAKYSFLKPTEPQVLGSKEPFIVQEEVAGRNYKTLYYVKSQSVPTTLEEFNSLPRQEQLRWKKLVEKTTNLKIKLEDTPKILGENYEKFRNVVATSKAGRLTISGGKAELKTPYEDGFRGFNKVLEIQETSTISQTTETPSGLFEISKSWTGYGKGKTLRDMTFERVGGLDKKGMKILYHGTAESNLPSIFDIGLKPSEITGKNVGLSEKSLVSLGTNKLSVKGYASRSALKNRLVGIQDKPVVLKVKVEPAKVEVGIGKTGIEEYRVLEVPKENIQIVEELQPLPKPSIKIKKVSNRIIKLEEVETPLMVGGKGGVTSIYAGTGQYEYQEPLGKISVSGFTEKALVSTNKLITQQENKIIQEENKLINIGRTGHKEMLQQREEVKQIMNLKENQITEQKQNQISKQSLKDLLGFKGATKQISKLKAISTPIIKPIVIKIIPSKGKVAKELSGEGEENLFEVFGRRFGKFKSLKKTKTQKEAEELALEFSKGGLGVSTSIEKGGKPIEFSLGTGFTKSKVNPLIQIQERSKRLSTYQEKKEIKQSKKRSRFF
jgi:hypothetical protein